VSLPVFRAPIAPFLAALLLAAACGPAAEPVTPPPPAEGPPPAARKQAPPAAGENPIESGDIQHIATDVDYLASPKLAGRGTGEEGSKLASDYLAKRFADLGLEPFGDGASGKDKAFTQRFSARVGAKVEPPALSVARGKKSASVAVADVVTADGSQSGEAKGDAVLAGHGITASAVGWDDYGGAEVAGKIVVVLDGAPKPEKSPDALRDFRSIRYKIRTAREHKAAGVIIVAAAEELPILPSDASGMGIPAVVIKRSAAKTLFPDVRWDDPALAAPKAAGKPKDLKGVAVTVTTKIEPTFSDAWNVVARLPAREGSKTANETVVIGAHYDHLGHGGTSASRAPGSHAVHPGADDNASGTALMLEVARRFSKLTERPARNVVFIGFGAEELGAIGSRYWVEHPPVPIGSVVAMVNADMVGRLRDKKLVVDGVATAAGWPDMLKAANQGLPLDLKLGGEGFGASDHASFTAARVPVAFFFTGVHDDYHLPSDTVEKIDAPGINVIATLAARLTHALAERPDRLKFVDAPADPHKGGSGGRGGFRVSLGTIPDYAWQGKGVKLTGVRPDAPASRAGMQGGDVIVKLGKHDITNVHDYTFALGDLEPGRETTVEVERDGKRVSLKIVPAPGR